MPRTKEDIKNDIKYLESYIKNEYEKFAEYERRYLREKIGDRTTKTRLYNEWKRTADYKQWEIEKLKEELKAFNQGGSEAYQRLIEQRKEQAKREELKKIRNLAHSYEEAITKHRREWTEQSDKDTMQAKRSYDEMERCKRFLYEQISKAPQGCFSLLEKASALYACSKYEEAAACYDKYLKEHPDSIEGLVGKARILWITEKYRMTITYCNKVLELDPDNWNAKYYKKEVKKELSTKFGCIVAGCVIILVIVLMVTSC